MPVDLPSSPRPAPRRILPRWLLVAFLWIGLAVCAGIVVKLWPDTQLLLRQFHVSDAALLVLIAAGIAAAGVASWRSILHSFAGIRLPMRSAVRQVGLLAIGKYLPGGVLGFVARLQDGRASAPTAALLAAGVYEQLLGLVVVALCGGVLLASARLQQLPVLACLALVPLLTAAGVRLAIMVLAMVPLAWIRARVGSLGSSRATLAGFMRGSAWMQVANLGWLVIVIFICLRGFQLELPAAVGVAGAFALAIVSGMLALFAPGGIGVREAAFVAFSAPWLEPTQAIVLAATLRIITLGFDMLLGLGAAVATHLPPPSGAGAA